MNFSKHKQTLHIYVKYNSKWEKNDQKKTSLLEHEVMLVIDHVQIRQTASKRDGDYDLYNYMEITTLQLPQFYLNLLPYSYHNFISIVSCNQSMVIAGGSQLY